MRTKSMLVANYTQKQSFNKPKYILRQVCIIAFGAALVSVPPFTPCEGKVALQSLLCCRCYLETSVQMQVFLQQTKAWDLQQNNSFRALRIGRQSVSLLMEKTDQQSPLADESSIYDRTTQSVRSRRNERADWTKRGSATKLGKCMATWECLQDGRLMALA